MEDFVRCFNTRAEASENAPVSLFGIFGLGAYSSHAGPRRA